MRSDQPTAQVAQTTIPWPQNSPKRVCVTNFGKNIGPTYGRSSNANKKNAGFGGSNAAIILDEAPGAFRLPRKYANGIESSNGHKHTNGNVVSNENVFSNRNRILDRSGISNGDGHSNESGAVTHNHLKHDSVKRLFVFSAKSESALTAYLLSFKEYLGTASYSSSFAKDLSFTLGQRRSHYPHRIAVVADSIASLDTQLTTVKSKKAKEQIIAFAFTGQGAQ